MEVDALMTKPHGIIAIFFREDRFYPIQFMGLKPAREEAEDHAVLNPGVTRIEDTHGRILWKAGTVQ